MVVTDDIETICIKPELINGKINRGTTIEEVIYKGESVWFDTKRDVNVVIDRSKLGLAFRKMMVMCINDILLDQSMEHRFQFLYSELMLNIKTISATLTRFPPPLAYRVKGEDGTLLFEDKPGGSTSPYTQKIPTYIFKGKNVKFFDKITIEFFTK